MYKIKYVTKIKTLKDADENRCKGNFTRNNVMAQAHQNIDEPTTSKIKLKQMKNMPPPSPVGTNVLVLVQWD